MISKARDSMGKTTSPWITKVIVRATELNNESISVLQIGASLCYKLEQLHYYKLGQLLLQIGAAITNQGNRYYKIGQLLQIRAKFITIFRFCSELIFLSIMLFVLFVMLLLLGLESSKVYFKENQSTTKESQNIKLCWI